MIPSKNNKSIYRITYYDGCYKYFYGIGMLDEIKTLRYRIKLLTASVILLLFYVLLSLLVFMVIKCH